MVAKRNTSKPVKKKAVKKVAAKNKVATKKKAVKKKTAAKKVSPKKKKASKKDTVEATSSPLIIRAAAAQALIERRRLRNSITPFIRKTFETVDPKAGYKHNWHIDLISEYLEAVYLGQIENLIINIPPRSIKSIAVSVAFPAWLLGRDPSEQVINSSYAAKLSIKHSIDCRTVMESKWYRAAFPETKFASDQNEKSKFVTTKRGHRIATSVGASAVGEGGNYLICDDPINPQEALSDTVRLTTNEWLDQTWSSRKNDQEHSKEILIMQRLHVDDPTGHLLKNGDWEHLVIPQIAESKTTITFPISGRVITRFEGDVLHEERMGKKKVEDMKRRLGTYGFAGQQQQRPVPRGGGRIKIDWFKRHRKEPEEWDEVIISLDTAQKDKQINNPSVGEVFCRMGSIWYLTHIWKDRVRYPELKQHVIAMAGHYHPDGILIEDKSSGASLIQELNQNTSLPVIGVEPEADKVTRMDTQTPSLEAGIISLPDPTAIHAPWLSSFEENIMHFPSCAEWDEIDALSQFLKHLRKREQQGGLPVVPFGLTGKSNWRGAI